MAIREFKCEACEHVTEKIMPIKDPIPEEIDCEKCNEKAKKVFAISTTFVLNGNGYYSTDYKGKK